MYINTLYSDWTYCHSSEKEGHHVIKYAVPIKIVCGQVYLI